MRNSGNEGCGLVEWKTVERTENQFLEKASNEFFQGQLAFDKFVTVDRHRLQRVVQTNANHDLRISLLQDNPRNRNGSVSYTIVP
ncbi:MAG TPA: hypothetical protein VFV38_26900 [Ktedonobacteraceae bacterium]|nr:hypothetical protein [Ktedonobacteraceae bacterium]